MSRTKGHLATNGGIRGHSAGELFPFIVFAMGTFDNTRWCIKRPDGTDYPFKFKDCGRAHRVCKRLKEEWCRD